MEKIRFMPRANRLAVQFPPRKSQSRNCTVAAYAKRWTRRAAIYLHPRTLSGYKGRLRNHIIPALGSRQLRSLTRDEVAQFIMSLFKRGLGRYAVVNVIVILRRMYYDAMEHGEVLYNPAAGALRGFHWANERTTIEPLRLNEARCFLSAAKRYDPHWYPLFLCAITTGMRRGELLALRPCDIDFELRFINVRSSVHGGILTLPKSYKIRRIDMNDRLAEVLSRFLSSKIALALKLEREKPRNDRRTKEKVLQEVMGKPLFTCLHTGGLDPGSINRVFWRNLKKAGLRHIRFHDLRHTFATLLIQQGENLAYVRDQLGHYSIRTTIDFYGHLIAGSNKAAVDCLASAIDDRSIRPEPERFNKRTTAIVTRKSDYLRTSWL